jgi:hypothetical protein
VRGGKTRLKACLAADSRRMDGLIRKLGSAVPSGQVTEFRLGEVAGWFQNSTRRGQRTRGVEPSSCGLENSEASCKTTSWPLRESSCLTRAS